MQNVHGVLDVSPIPPVVDSIDYTLLLGVAAAAQCIVRFAGGVHLYTSDLGTTFKN